MEKIKIVQKYLLLIAFQMTVISVSACTTFPSSFCGTLHVFQDNLIISGQIVSKDTDGIDVMVINLLRGEETRDTIRIWDGTDYIWCMDTTSLAAGLLGDIGDTLLMNLPMIDSMENTWDVIGDYRRPDILDFWHTLRVTDGIIHGFIRGSTLAPPEFRQLSANYVEFIENWDEFEECTNGLVDVEEVEQENYQVTYTNPVNNFLRIHINSLTTINEVLEVYTFNGQLLKSVAIRSNEISFDFSDYPRGLYLLKIGTDNNRIWTGRLVKI